MDLGTLRLTLAGNIGDTATVDDLLLYLNDSINGFGYSASDATPAGPNDNKYFFEIDMPDDLFAIGDVYLGWDFGAFNAGYGAGIGVLGATSVPEPATWCMLLAGFAGLMWFRRRR